ncbi:hypothetical protein [Beggiatoa leptomitoformis]|uniref:Uncharacterized protein n=1 Tax=Beggiatoa leptomitoformis TaxID=288004 RepID=A0A2N9YED2_9GAMM|nr:hypothetical protein [Beggiatoa leptomitoformis]ALG68795.1 hypothetical protein AL038_15190 [Beggiatoa leptomitoformis]AUI68842.1 hypothetical protein BLE401_09065 [Beggiatoa leptomitoformis]
MTVSAESISKTIFNDIKEMEKKPSDEGKAINDRIRRAVEDKLNLKSIGLRRLVRGEWKLCSLVCKPKNVANR